MNEPQGTDAERAMDKMQDLQRENDRLVDEGMRQKADLRSVTEERDLLQDELDTRARTVSNESQIKFLEDLLDAEREQTNTKSTQLAQAVKLAADRLKEIDHLQTSYHKVAKAGVDLRKDLENARGYLEYLREGAANKTVEGLREELKAARAAVLRLRGENRAFAKEVDDRDTRLAQLAKRIRDYHESLGELIDEVQDLERANGALTDLVAELRESQAMSQFDKIKDAPDF